MWKYFYVITDSTLGTIKEKDINFIKEHLEATKILLEDGYTLHTQLEGKHFTAYYFYKEVE